MYEALAKTFAAAVGPLLRWLRPLKAQRTAGEAPEKFRAIDQALLDGAFRRLSVANPSDSIFAHSYDAATNAYCTPEFLRTRSVQDWLQQPGVKPNLQLVASSKALGTRVSLEAAHHLEATYGEVASANPQEARAVVAALVAILAAAIEGHVDDKGVGAMLAASSKQNERDFDGVNAKLDNLLSASTPVPRPHPELTALDTDTASEWREAFTTASSGLLGWPTTLADGQQIPRPELAQLLETMVSKKRGTVALLGLPGSGKSALLADLGQQLTAKAEVSVLAIKADLLDASVTSEEDLRQDLHLPELPSIMLRRLAARAPVVLLIDQLDALAGHLDAKTGRLSALLNLVKAVSSADGVFVFVSCRTFEFTHDLRLSRIDAESLTLELPSWEQVLPILEANGVRSTGWNTDAREVMRVPQQLNTYLQLKAAGIDEPFSSYTAMLDSLWSVRVLSPPGGGRAALLAFDIAEVMADKETLWLAASRFDERVKELNFLVSAGILTTTKEGAIGFSHQTVFEHVLARSFAKNDGRLSAYVLSRANSLFVRPKLWAALAYLRGVEPTTYSVELAALWNTAGLRKHLRFLLLEFMGAQSKPTNTEEVLLVAASEQDELRPIVLKAITGSQGWFERLSGTVVASAMSNPNTGDMCIEILASAWSHSPEAVAKLLRENWLPSPHNDRRVLFVLQEATTWTPGLVDIGTTVASRVNASASHVDHLVSVIGGTEPKVAIELLRPFLVGMWARTKAEALHLEAVAEADPPGASERDVAWHMQHNPMRPMSEFLDDRNQWGSIPELAASSPSHFLATLWPWYLNAFRDMLALKERDEPYFGYPLPYSADFRFEGEDRNRLQPSSILEAIAVAVEGLAEVAPLELLQWAREQARVELAPVQRLIAHALTRNPAQTATAALDFLLEDERRYFLGGISDSTSTTLALVAACAPHWTPDEVSKFTTKVKSYTTVRPVERNTPEDVRAWSRIGRRTRVNLIRALPTATRSPEIQREVDEGNRALPQRMTSDEFAGGWVGSTMQASQFARASTDAILNAFKVIPDEAGWDHPTHFGRGGNVQLARAFAEFAKEHPDRALQVIEKLQPESGQRAAGYALETLAEVCDPDKLMALFIQLHGKGFDGDEFKSSVARAVERILSRDVVASEPVLEMLEGWVASIESESHDEDAIATERSGSSKEEGFLLSGHPRVEFLPAGDYPIVAAIVSARYARNEAAAVTRLLRRYLDISQNTRVWESLVRFMAPLPTMDANEGPRLVGDVLALSQLDGSQGAAVLMAKTHWRALAPVMSNLRRWRDSERMAARKGYGELVALISLTNSEKSEAAKWLVEVIETPVLADARAGAAATAAQLLWIEPQFRAAATDLLLALLEKNESAVWHQVFGLFLLVDKLEPEPHTVRLMRGIADRIQYAPAPNEPYVVDRLGGLLPGHADLVARIASQLIQLWRDKLANMGSSLVTAGQEMMDLAVTLHRTEGTQLAGLQMFEQLIEIDAYQAREVLDEIDHRIRPGARRLRPRLRRRVGRRTRR